MLGLNIISFPVIILFLFVSIKIEQFHEFLFDNFFMLKIGRLVKFLFIVFILFPICSKFEYSVIILYLFFPLSSNFLTKNKVFFILKFTLK